MEACQRLLLPFFSTGRLSTSFSSCSRAPTSHHFFYGSAREPDTTCLSTTAEQHRPAAAAAAAAGCSAAVSILPRLRRGPLHLRCQFDRRRPRPLYMYSAK
ncbi:hypothetical protein VPH35_011364 [Triticum aestivum]